jgi:hypothetical protein
MWLHNNLHEIKKINNYINNTINLTSKVYSLYYYSEMVIRYFYTSEIVCAIDYACLKSLNKVDTIEESDFRLACIDSLYNHLSIILTNYLLGIIPTDYKEF